MTQTRHAFSRTADPPSLEQPKLTLAVTMLLLAATTFLLPTAFSLAISVRDALGGTATVTIAPLFAAYSFAMGSEIEFVRDFWTTLPALVVGVFAARPQTRFRALRCIAVLMFVVALLGSLALHFPPSETDLREVAVVIGGPYEQHLDALKHLPSSISLTRAIAVTYLTAALAKVLTEKANR